jgi:hypothetical protein
MRLWVADSSRKPMEKAGVGIFDEVGLFHLQLFLQSGGECFKVHVLLLVG